MSPRSWFCSPLFRKGNLCKASTWSFFFVAVGEVAGELAGLNIAVRCRGLADAQRQNLQPRQLLASSPLQGLACPSSTGSHTTAPVQPLRLEPGLLPQLWWSPEHPVSLFGSGSRVGQSCAGLRRSVNLRWEGAQWSSLHWQHLFPWDLLSEGWREKRVRR